MKETRTSLPYGDIILFNPGHFHSLLLGGVAFVASMFFELQWNQARADRSTPDPTRTQIALPLETPPVIDGFIDPAEWGRAGGAAGNFWQVIFDANLEDSIRGGVLGDSAAPPPASNEDLSFDIIVGYDADNLYIAVRVRDDSLQNDDAAADSANGDTFLDDSVEVFIDGDNSNFATRDTTGTNTQVVATGGQFVIAANNAYREMEAGNPGYGDTAAWFARSSPTDTGYEAEFRISLASLGNPQPGDVIGFTIGVNDDDDGTTAERQVLWVGQTHTEATYGNLLLGGRSYTAPETAAPTVDGTINASEYAGATQISMDSQSAIFDIPSGDDTAEPADLSYRAWIVHDTNAIYIAVDVTDDSVNNDSAEAGSEDSTTWEDDSVEVFFDADNSKDDGRGVELYEGQYVFTANGAWRDAEANNPTFGAEADWFAATTRTATGYAVEFKIMKSALLNPADDASLGFHIAVNDDDGANRAAQMGWSGRAHSEFTYGELKLGGASNPGGPLNIDKIVVNGNNLELTLTTSNPAGTHAIQRSSTLLNPQWTDVTGSTFSPGAGGTVVGSLPRPTTAPEFYRAVLR